MSLEKNYRIPEDAFISEDYEEINISWDLIIGDNATIYVPIQATGSIFVGDGVQLFDFKADLDIQAGEDFTFNRGFAGRNMTLGDEATLVYARAGGDFSAGEGSEGGDILCHGLLKLGSDSGFVKVYSETNQYIYDDTCDIDFIEASYSSWS